MNRFIAVFIIALALFSARTYIPSSFPYTHDGENHLARFANYYLALKEGQYPPRWAPNLINRYGYPVFNFNYPLANIISLPFRVVDIPYERTFSAIVIGSTIFAFTGIYYWLHSYNFSNYVVVITIIIYSINSYLLNLLFYRGSIGEILALTILPWLFYQIHLIAQKKEMQVSTNESLVFVVSIATFLLSHNSIAFITVPFLFVLMFSIFVLDKKWAIFSFIKFIFIHFLTAFLLVAWFWIPAVFEMQNTILQTAQNNNEFSSHFVGISQMLTAPIEFGFSEKGSIDGLSFRVSIFMIVAIFLFPVYIFYYYKKNARILSFSLLPFYVFSILFLFLQLEESKHLWSIPFLKYMQFPWRFAGLFSLTILPILAMIFSLLNRSYKVWFSILILIEIFWVVSLKSIDSFHKSNETYEAFSQSTSTQNENLPSSFKYLDFGNWHPHPIINGVGEYSVESWNGTKKVYTLSLSSKSTIIEPTARFDGWVTTANDEPIEYIDSEEIAGRIAYTLNQGFYRIETQFTQKTLARRIGNYLSLATFLTGLMYIAHSKYVQKK